MSYPGKLYWSLRLGTGRSEMMRPYVTRSQLAFLGWEFIKEHYIHNVQTGGNDDYKSLPLRPAPNQQ
jgi:hypothetical protein